jgi:hypothetical protein
MIAVPSVRQFVYQGMTFHEYRANAGEGIPKHDHLYAHLTWCLAGSCRITKKGHEMICTPNTPPVNLAAKQWHEIEALEDGTVFVNAFRELTA